MKRETDPKAITRWEKSDISYRNYRKYIEGKPDRYELTLIDLLYIANFKGGSATIHIEEEEANRKLLSYSEGLKKIEKNFGSKQLRELSSNEIDMFIEECIEPMLKLLGNNETRISGFGVSYLSALLSAYFPNLLPVLGRRVLINLKLAKGNDILDTGQIKDSRHLYGSLIEKIAKISKKKPKTLREIDKDVFTEFSNQ